MCALCCSSTCGITLSTPWVCGEVGMPARRFGRARVLLALDPSTLGLFVLAGLCSTFRSPFRPGRSGSPCQGSAGKPGIKPPGWGPINQSRFFHWPGITVPGLRRPMVPGRPAKGVGGVVVAARIHGWLTLSPEGHFQLTVICRHLKQEAEETRKKPLCGGRAYQIPPDAASDYTHRDTEADWGSFSDSS